MNENLLSLISEGLTEVRNNGVYHQKLERAIATLDDVWNPVVFSISTAPEWSADEWRAPELPPPKPPPPRRPPPWYIGMSSNFTKAISKSTESFKGASSKR
jgi:alkanesulfonate monooxygenase SsuD/methylene tetrahydromethanopterin reductase-like flavin-dependent oxidoreductase (luciferase family)